MYRILFLLISFTCILSCSTIDVTQNEITINQVLDAWHHAAAVADEDVFFNTFTQNAIYIGTDATEHWTANELKSLFKNAFEKEVAWAFEPHNRHIYFSEDKKTAWFDELLKTWMGPCRGSGVMQRKDDEWKIVHYHLSVAVPNDIIQDYIKLLPKENIAK